MKNKIRMPGIREIEVIFNIEGISSIKVEEPAKKEPIAKFSSLGIFAS